MARLGARAATLTSHELQRYDGTRGHVRVLSVWLLVAALVVFSKPTPFSVSAGFAFVVLGEILRCWAAGHLHKTVKLITSGPYRYTRNPLYLGRLLIFTGITIMASFPYYANWIVLVSGYLVFFGYYLPRKDRGPTRRSGDRAARAPSGCRSRASIRRGLRPHRE